MKNFWKTGDPFIWLTGTALMFSLIAIFGLLFIIASKGLGFFWPSDIAQVELIDGTKYLGQISGREKIRKLNTGEAVKRTRVQLKVGNRDIYGFDFKWIDDDKIKSITYPENAFLIERLEWGNMYGFVTEIKEGSNIISSTKEQSIQKLAEILPKTTAKYKEIKEIEKYDIGDINYAMEGIRLKKKNLNKTDPEDIRKIEELNKQFAEQEEKFKVEEKKLITLYTELDQYKVKLETVDDRSKEFSAGIIVRAYRPNSMGTFSKFILYLDKFWEFLSADPREANTEGGVFPAIFGTVMMVLIMSIVVLPFGVLAALYLREYAKQGPMVRVVRICVNNLAGVPSIVFGVFAVGFFIYGIGGAIDQVLYSDNLPAPTYGTGGILWASLTLALLTVPVVIVATEEGLAAVPKNIKEGSLALGATKFETMWKVVLPSAMPAIMTGLILAIARATGEVAPLMITGVVKLAPDLPIDGHFPFVHFERKFMHLGFHIYDVGFQSPNVEAAKPMVYTTTLLLIVIVIVLNLAAIVIRNRLKKKYTSSQI
ncbi:MAG: phosphate ABC transporter permease PstA [Candidatus Dadabacteria bacterium]|nr:phosphate ABC transporter permease PstA [Candidatus Dadabacteria bacterium]NIS07613.1 phosphate ABC transporter permease PstA [Candidatus Dadabacteria bacterium]NIV42067.1 phosphate ABC transporter permease PstA [Candidatus Dadabacteria bacterium]NIX16472.1 phosphate ABC transporter permease PstA [Candidatus Dadabacteria bacterium]NIY21251.1 phosphate ABC transporter permease PstA [Candidatus Dadabacteria bacterium]